MDNLPPGPCPNCGKAAKPLFNSYYCDCDKEAQPTKCIHGKPQYEGALPTCEDCRVDFYPTTPSSAKIIVNGVQMTHWWECDHCHQEAFYFDRDPSTIVMNSRYVSRRDGLFQINHFIFDHQNPLCDSCGLPLSGRNFSLDHLHKY